jgi:autoinducer 2-degrading protein
MTSRPLQLLYVVVVEFRVQPDRAEEFTRLLLDNAQASRELEPGCRQFDVCRWPSDPGRFLLYELYDDRQAFQDHLGTAHFKAFDTEVAPWIIEKTVHTLDRLAP